MNKSDLYIKIEGLLYVIIGGLPSFVSYLDSDSAVTMRGIIAAALGSLIGAAVALKAFMSQSSPNK